jgi:hypothetical protein
MNIKRSDQILRDTNNRTYEFANQIHCEIASKGMIPRNILKNVRNMCVSMRMGVTDHLKIRNIKYEY